MTRKTMLYIIICLILSCSSYAYADEPGKIYMIYPQDFEQAGYRFIKDSDTSAHIRNLSEEDIRKSMESGEGIWHDEIIGETGDKIEAYFVMFKDGKACVVKDRDYVRGANGNAINTELGTYNYSLTAEFLTEDDTYIVAGDDFMTDYAMPATVTPSYDEIIPLYFFRTDESESHRYIVTGKARDTFECSEGERVDGYFAVEKDGKYEVQTDVSAENDKLTISYNDAGVSTVVATGTGEENLYMYSNDRSEKYMMAANIAETEQGEEEIDGAFIRIIKGIIAIFKR